VFDPVFAQSTPPELFHQSQLQAIPCPRGFLLGRNGHFAWLAHFPNDAKPTKAGLLACGLGAAYRNIQLDSRVAKAGGCGMTTGPEEAGAGAGACEFPCALCAL